MKTITVLEPTSSFDSLSLNVDHYLFFMHDKIGVMLTNYIRTVAFHIETYYINIYIIIRFLYIYIYTKKSSELRKLKMFGLKKNFDQKNGIKIRCVLKRR